MQLSELGVSKSGEKRAITCFKSVAGRDFPYPFSRANHLGTVQSVAHRAVRAQSRVLRGKLMKPGVGRSRFVALCVFLLCGLSTSVCSQQLPTYEITGGESVVTFEVESSVPIKGKFDKWDATMKFTSADVKSGVLDIVIQADSVDTGSGLKNNKLKGKDFFNVKESPTITFRSNKVVQTGPNTFELDGDFSIRGVKKTEKLILVDHGKGSTEGNIEGTMAFDRKDYGMTKNIPFVKIADRVEVSVNLRWKRVSGPAPVFEQ